LSASERYGIGNPLEKIAITGHHGHPRERHPARKGILGINVSGFDMARSPLMSALQRLAREHAEASWRGVDIARAREERAAAFVERRQFLQGAGAAAGAALISRTRPAKADAPTKGNQPKIVIVGAGIAGLNAALTLQDAGLASTIYESSHRIGGRMQSDATTWQNQQKSEWCGEFIDTGQKTILKLASRFGLTVIDEIAAQPAGSSDTLYFDGMYYPQEQADKDFAPVSAILQQQVKAAPSTLYNSYTQTGYDLDHMSVYDWIENYVHGGHKSQLGRYLDSAYNQEYGLDTPLQSSLNLVYLLGFQPPSGPWQIYGLSDQRYSILGGNQLLPEAIAASLPTGSVITESTLTSIRQASGGGYFLTFNSAAGLKTVQADVVILTLPFSVLRKLDYSSAGFDALKQVAIQQLGYGTNTKLSLQFSKRYWNSTGSWGTGDGNIYTDLFFQNTWDSSRGLSGPTGVLTAYMGGSNGASFTRAASPYASAATDPYVRKYAKEFLSQLENVWPGVSNYWNGLATLSTPWTDPNLFGSYACWLVGQYTKFAGYERVPQGNCYFAGEHCSINSQGYMEGGAQEGASAARQMIKAHTAVR
jgi:monoamine oxidase